MNRLGFGMALVLVAGCAAPRARPQPTLSFDPPMLNVDGIFPGVHTFTVTLRNHEARPVKANMSLTCGCLKILKPKFPTELAANGSQKVVLEFTADRQENINQAAYAMSSRSTPSAELPIRGRLGSPLVLPSSLAVDLKRPVPGAKTSRETVFLPLRHKVEVTSVTSDVPALKPSFRREGDKLALSVEAEADADDQETTAGLMVFYKAGDFSGKCLVPVRVSVASEFKFDRSSFWLGRLKPGEKVERRVTISGQGAAARVTVNPARIERISADEIVATLTVVGASKPGLSTSRFDILVDGKKLGAVTCSYQSARP